MMSPEQIAAAGIALSGLVTGGIATWFAGRANLKKTMASNGDGMQDKTTTSEKFVSVQVYEQFEKDQRISTKRLEKGQINLDLKMERVEGRLLFKIDNNTDKIFTRINETNDQISKKVDENNKALIKAIIESKK